jgi:hypothetical protein
VQLSARTLSWQAGGSNATVTFELGANDQICRADVEASPTPVFLDEPGGNREALVVPLSGWGRMPLYSITQEGRSWSPSHSCGGMARRCRADRRKR